MLGVRFRVAATVKGDRGGGQHGRKELEQMMAAVQAAHDLAHFYLSAFVVKLRWRWF